MSNWAPCGESASVISPPCSLTMLYVIERPRPVPAPTSFVVKNGSKIRDWISSAMPGPESARTIWICSPSSRDEIRIRRSERLGERVARVGQQVDEDLLELDRVAEHDELVRREVELDLDRAKA